MKENLPADAKNRQGKWAFVVSCFFILVVLTVALYMTVNRGSALETQLFLGCFIIAFCAVSVYAIAHFNREVQRKVWALIVVGILVAGIFANINIYAKNESRLYKNGIDRTENEYTLMGYYSAMYFDRSYEVDDSSLTLLSTVMGSEMIGDRRVAVAQDAFESNSFLRKMLSRVPKDQRHIAELEAELEEDVKNYDAAQEEAQTIIFENSQNETQTILLFTGREWLEDEQLCVVKDGEKLAIIPQSMLHEEAVNRWEQAPEGAWQTNEEAVFHWETVFFSKLKPDDFINRICGIGYGFYTTVLRQLAFLVYLIVIGLVFLFPWAQALRGGIYPAMALPVGMALYVLVVYVMGLAQIPLSIITCFGIPFVLAVLVAVFARNPMKKVQQGAWPAESLFGIGNMLALAVVLCVCLVVSASPKYYMTNDSLQNINIGIRIAENQGFSNNMYQYTSYSIVGSLFQAGIRMLGGSFNYAYLTPLIVSGLLALFLLIRKMMGKYDIKGWKAALIGVLAIAMVTSEPLMRFNTVWLLNNLPIGIWMALATALLVLYFQTKSAPYLALSFILFLMFAISRIEGPLFAVVFLACVRPLFENKDHHLKYTAAVSLVILLQFIVYFLYMHGKDDAVFWSPFKGGILAVLAAAFTAWLFIQKKLAGKKPVAFIDKHLVLLMGIALLAGNIAACVFRTDFMYINAKSLFVQMFVNGNHGFMWIGVLALFLASFFVKGPKDVRQFVRFFIQYTACFMLALLALMSMRVIPLHEGPGDSGSRILLHLIPSFAIMIALLMTAFVAKARGKRMQADKRLQMEETRFAPENIGGHQ